MTPIRREHAREAPVPGIHRVDDDVRVLRALAEHALQSRRDFGDERGLLGGGDAVSGDANVHVWHDGIADPVARKTVKTAGRGGTVH